MKEELENVNKLKEDYTLNTERANGIASAVAHAIKKETGEDVTKDVEKGQ